MTAEVALLNRSSIALAADSALTTGLPGHEKIFFGANKIFTLSKYSPVGVMIYGSGDFFSIPWETLIKEFRKSLGKKTFGKLSDYKEEFIAFASQPRFVTGDEQDMYVLIAAMHTAYTMINGLRKKGKPSRVKEIRDELDSMISKTEEMGQLNGFSDISFNKFNKQYGDRVRDFLEDDEYFKFNIPKTCWPRFVRCVFEHATTNMRTTHSSGIVFAGFGEDELFPSLTEVKIDGGIFDRLRIFSGCDIDISRGKQSVAIEAFAQTDVVDAIVQGFNDKYRNKMLSMLRGFLRAQIDDLIENHTRYDENTKKTIRASQKKKIPDAIKDFAKNIDSFANIEYYMPAMDVLRHATKDEMAEIAEALVSITSIRKRVSQERETVGGLVDVAVISKGDGFVWIKRKHYFEQSLNHHYFKNYFPT